MTPYQQAVLDGFNELVAQTGTGITFQPSGATYDALLVFPSAGDQSQDAGLQLTAGGGVQMRRADFAAAAVNDSSRFTVPGQPAPLQVDEIEDDGVQSVVYFSIREAR